MLLHNIALVKYVGNIGISAYSILNYLTTNIYMVLYGITLGVQSLLSYNYERKDFEKLIGFFKITCISSTIISFIFGQKLIGIFTVDPYIAKGEYITLNFDDDYNDTGKYYKSLIEYIHKNNIEVSGDFYEIYIMTRVGNDGKEMSLGQIQILMKK